MNPCTGSVASSQTGAVPVACASSRPKAMAAVLLLRWARRACRGRVLRVPEPGSVRVEARGAGGLGAGRAALDGCAHRHGAAVPARRLGRPGGGAGERDVAGVALRAGVPTRCGLGGGRLARPGVAGLGGDPATRPGAASSVPRTPSGSCWVMMPTPPVMTLPRARCLTKLPSSLAMLPSTLAWGWPVGGISMNLPLTSSPGVVGPCRQRSSAVSKGAACGGLAIAVEIAKPRLAGRDGTWLRRFPRIVRGPAGLGASSVGAPSPARSAATRGADAAPPAAPPAKPAIKVSVPRPQQLHGRRDRDELIKSDRRAAGPHSGPYEERRP